MTSSHAKLLFRIFDVVTYQLQGDPFGRLKPLVDLEFGIFHYPAQAVGSYSTSSEMSYLSQLEALTDHIGHYVCSKEGDPCTWKLWL